MEQIKLIDNFLPEDTFKDFKNIFFDSKFPWYFSEISVHEGDNFPMFCHIVYMDMQPQSFVWEMIQSMLINRLGLKINQSILRVKANAIQRSKSIEKTALHYDIISHNDEVLPHNVAIIYLNNNDGYTFFEDGAKIESVANRCIIFPGNLKHAGTSCTNAPLRAILNINYTI